MVARYPEWRRIYVERLSLALPSDPEAKSAFHTKLSAYFSGEVPHCRDIIPSTFLCLMDKSTIRYIPRQVADDPNTILRVSCSWPNRTKKALCSSLDSGIIDGFELEIVHGQEESTHLVYLPSAIIDDGVRSPQWRCGPLTFCAESSWLTASQTSTPRERPLRARLLSYNVSGKSSSLFLSPHMD